MRRRETDNAMAVDFSCMYVRPRVRENYLPKIYGPGVGSARAGCPFGDRAREPDGMES